MIFSTFGNISKVDCSRGSEEKYYRFEAKMYSGGCDEYDNPLPGHQVINLYIFPVLKHTPCGVWIDAFEKRFINKNWLKQYASPTPEEAARNFIARKNAHIRIVSKDLERAMQAKDEVARWLEKNKQKGLTA